MDNEMAASDEQLLPPNQRRKIGLLAFLGVSSVTFFVVDAAVPLAFRAENYRGSAIPALVCLGVVTAQLTVICVWGTLVRGTFWVRLPWTLFLLVISWCCLALGVSFLGARESLADAEIVEMQASVGFIWAFGFLMSYLPLKVVAVCFKWEIVQDHVNQDKKYQPDRYGIREMMLGIAMLAISMGIVRSLVPADGISLMGALERSIFGNVEAMISTTVFGVVSLIVKLPCIWIGLGQKQERLVQSTIVWGFLCLLLTLLEVGLLFGLMGPPPDPFEVLGGLAMCHLVMGGVILGLCLALRSMGYRLIHAVTLRTPTLEREDTHQNL